MGGQVKRRSEDFVVKIEHRVRYVLCPQAVPTYLGTFYLVGFVL